MMLSSSMHVVIAQAGILILSIYANQEIVGQYAVAARLAMLASFILVALNTIAAPTYARLFHSNQIPEMIRIARKSAQLIFWTTLPIFLILSLSGRAILGLFRPEFIDAYPVLLTLLTGQFFNAQAGSTAQLLDMTGRHLQLRNVMMVAAAANIMLTIILIPKWGIWGAAVAAAGSTILWNTLALIRVYKEFGGYVGFMPFRNTVVQCQPP